MIVSTSGYYRMQSIYWSTRFKIILLTRSSELTHCGVSYQTAFGCKRICPATGTFIKDCLSSVVMTPSINLYYKKQQRSFVWADGVVPTQDYPNKGILSTTTTLWGRFLWPSLDPEVFSCSLPHQWHASTKVLGITRYKDWCVFPWEWTEDEHTTLDFNRKLSSLTSIQNKWIIPGNNGNA
jgi:hypothetical protein